MKYLGLVRAIATQMHRDTPGVMEFDDFISLGAAGLIEAAHRYDPSTGVAFPAFAYGRVRGAMYDGLRKSCVLPRKHYQRIKQAAARRHSAGGPGAGEAGAADSESGYKDIPVFVNSIAAMDLVDGELPDPEWLRAGDVMARNYLAKQVCVVLGTLPAPERQVIVGCYFEGKTLEEVSQDIGRSRSWACRLHARAMARLRKALVDDEAKNKAAKKID